MEALKIALWSLPAIGAVGMFALFVGAPAAFAAAVTLGERAIVAVLSTRVGLAATVGIAALVVGDVHRRDVDAVACENRVIELRQEAAAAAQNRDASIAREIEAKYQPQLAGLEKQSQDLQKQVSTYEKKLLAGAAGGNCKLGDALRLRHRK
jgi:hypothetical protein